MRNNNAKHMALGGVLAALAVVIMAMGTLIPVATYVCPMLCCLMLQLVKKTCGDRTAWAWYAAVALLGVLMAPDKEAAAVFCALGYYPIVKPKLDEKRFAIVWKLALFNSVILVLYWLLMYLFGFAAIAAEFAEMGTLLTVLTLALGNVVFFLLDRLLSRGLRKK